MNAKLCKRLRAAARRGGHDPSEGIGKVIYKRMKSMARNSPRRKT